jgi:hypothetical protein
LTKEIAVKITRVALLGALLSTSVFAQITSPGGSGGSGTPGGSDTQVQFNDGGSFGGDSGLVWDKTNDYLTGPLRVRFGGTTSSFPMLKRNSAALDVRLADDSAYATLNAGSFVAQAAGGGTVAMNGSSSGTLTLLPNSTSSIPQATHVAGGSASNSTSNLVRIINISGNCNGIQGLGTTLDAGAGTSQDFDTQCVFPANYFTAGKIVQIWFGVQEVGSGASVTRNYTLKFGSTTLNNTSGTWNPGNSATRNFDGHVTIRCEATGASGSIYTTYDFGSLPSSSAVGATTQPVTIDTTAAQTFKITAGFGGATAGNTDRILWMFVKELN